MLQFVLASVLLEFSEPEPNSLCDGWSLIDFQSGCLRDLSS